MPSLPTPDCQNQPETGAPPHPPLPARLPSFPYWSALEVMTFRPGRRGAEPRCRFPPSATGDPAMRLALTICLLALMPLPALAQAKKIEPVKIIDLKRTDPVVYQKEIEPIL